MGKTRWEFQPLTAGRWADLEELFGGRGACGGCWCMFWRLTRSQFNAGKGEKNRKALRKLVVKGPPPGILAYSKGKPVGWCAVAKREEYSTLGRSRILKPVDDAGVWSIPCFFIARPFRRLGLSVALLNAAADYVSRHGGNILEGYPNDLSPGKRLPDPFVYSGLFPAFLRAGFTEVARRSKTRPIMRREL